MSLQYMILGILKYGPRSGYDLNKAFSASVNHFWSTEQSQIYRALHKMYEAGWVHIEQITQENLPNKKIYHLTPKGREAFHRWLATPQGLAFSHEAWLGQIFFGLELHKDQLKHLLEERIAELKRLINHFEHEIPASALAYSEAYHASADLPYWLLAWDYGLQKLRFDLQWVQNTLASLSDLPEKENRQENDQT